MLVPVRFSCSMLSCVCEAWASGFSVPSFSPPPPIQAAAEAEALLAAGERSKAVMPLCVGISTTASAFSLLAPALVEDIFKRFGIQLVTEFYLIFPLISGTRRPCL